MFKKLLVPLDLSPLAEEAIGRAAAIARASGAKLDLLVVHQPIAIEAFDGQEWNIEQRHKASEYLDTVVKELATGAQLSATRTVLTGDPAEEVGRHAQRIGADLIVMTSHGRTGLSRAWLGSVADSVVRRSSVPVLMVRPTGAASRRSAHRPFERVLLPLDDSQLSHEVLEPALSLAKCSGASISLLRIVQPVPLIIVEGGMTFNYPLGPIDESATTRVAMDAQEHLTAVAREVRDYFGVDVETYVTVDGQVARAIIDFARAHDIDVIGMATHGRGASRLVLGSVVDKVLRGSDVPLLLYSPAKVDSEIGVRETDPAEHASAATL